MLRTVDVTAQYAVDDVEAAAAIRSARKALALRLPGLVEVKAERLWSMRDDARLSIRDRGLIGHHATDFLRSARAMRAGLLG